MSDYGLRRYRSAVEEGAIEIETTEEEHPTNEEKAMEERLQKLNDTRTLVDWLEAHPNVPLPQTIDFAGFGIYALNTKGEALMLAKEFGSATKEYNDDHLTIKKQFGTQTLQAVFSRKEVCERVVVGTKVVPEQVTPEHVQEIIEWRCDPILQDEAA